jgi:sigma-B regulation protein RsbU (phosphoserine phosphatase)
MSHFVVSRCGLYLASARGLDLTRARGLREVEGPAMDPEAASAALASLDRPLATSELPAGPLRRLLEKSRLSLAVPLAAGERAEGLLGLGARASGTAFSPEDREFAGTLARQAMTAIENARLHRLREEKQHRDRALQIARDIQRSLFPGSSPDIAGFEVAGESRPCFEVGGDSYDWIPLGRDRLALVVADVAGKGTPASLLMASVHASIQALAGAAGSPARVVERLDRFLFAKTQPSRYVTLFYAELDARSRRLAYVNAGHIPPYRLARHGGVSRLRAGGPAPGLLEGARYEVGEVILDPGDVVAIVTDGVTEAGSADDREFGDERVVETLRSLASESAARVLQGLVAAAESWMGPAGQGDDLTALVLKASSASPAEPPPSPTAP